MAKVAVEEDDKLWTIDDLAAFLRTSRTVAYKQYRRRKIPRVRIGSRVMFLPSEVRRWARAQVERGA